MKHITSITSTLSLFLCALLFTACQDDTAEVTPQPDAVVSEELESLVEEFNEGVAAIGESAEGNINARSHRRIPTFNVLLRALIKEDLLKAVLTNHWTAFLPTDQAFKEIGIDAHNVDQVEGLREILLYHVLPQRVLAAEFEAGFVPTLNGAAVEASFQGKKLFVNESQVIFTDLPLYRSVGHVINKVLLPPTKSLVQLVTGRPNLSLLAEALTKAGLVEAFTDEVSWTVFAPNNNAFAALLKELGFASLDDIPVDVLQDVLLYHVLGQRVYSSDLSDGLSVTALNEASFTFDLSGNGPRIVDVAGRRTGLIPSALNLQATNGVIHIITRVLLPFDPAPAPSKSLVDIVTGRQNLSLLAEALTKADLVGAFTDEVNWTVFAPNNDAFAALLEELGFASLDDIPVDVLREVLLYHVLDQPVFSSDLSDGLTATALNGGSFTFDLSGNRPFIVDANDRRIGLVPTGLDIAATNGVVHVVHRVLLPALDS